VTRLHKITLEPEEPYELWADGNGGGVEDADPEHRYYAGVLLLDFKDLGKVLDCCLLPLLSPRSAEERTRVVKTLSFHAGL
jgi:predicted GH43/DUF377 family glycosyl hydrolase